MTVLSAFSATLLVRAWRLRLLFLLVVTITAPVVAEGDPLASASEGTAGQQVGCSPRPRVQVTTTPSTDDALEVTVSAGNGTITRIQFGVTGRPVTQAVIDVVGVRTGIRSSTTLTLQPTRAQVVLVVRRARADTAMMVPLVITDGCGAWSTFVGAGAADLNPPTPTPSPTPTPTSGTRTSVGALGLSATFNSVGIELP